MGDTPNRLYYGDNLDVLRRYVDDESVDLVYLDPPFNSNATYNVLFAERDGSEAAAQIQAFGDTWQWNDAAFAAYEEVVEHGGDRASRALQAFRTFLGDNNLMAYLAMMAPRLLELRRVMKPTASIYLHCDPTASHYLKVLMDAVFGARHFQNEVVWYYRGGGVSKRRYGRRHDVLLFYSRGQEWTFNVDEVRTPYSPESAERLQYKAKSFRGDKVYDQYEPHPLGKHPDDVWELQPVMPSAKERLGYPTQKPERLLERVIKASSSEGDVVLDPFCGCGTTVVVAHRLKRRWLGIDVTHLAINLMKHRLQDAFGPEVEDEYEVVGEPVGVPDARQLAEDDPYQFQFWALGLVGARPVEEKRGPDKGIDGRLYFHDQPGGKTKQVILQVKAGQTGRKHVAELRGVVEREEAELGALISMREPTRPMRAEAASAGTYSSPWGDHPRIQLLTIEELLDGRRIDMPPPGTSVTYKRAPRAEREVAAEQGRLDV
jgi:site-specific DNA-methyltransferase (adenine-specific)